jgi:outer membrane protein assembly factor BamB
VLVFVAVLALPGCWLQPGYGPERQNSNPAEQKLTAANVATLHRAWATPWDTGGHPLVTPSTVYTGGLRSSGSQAFFTVRAAVRRSGAPLWQRDLATALVSFPPEAAGVLLSVGDGEVLTARAPGTFEKLDPATGATTAKLTLPGLRFVSPVTVAVDDDVIAYRETNIANLATTLVVRRRDTFAVLWTAPLDRFVPLGTDDAVLIAGGRIYVHDDPGGSPALEVYDAGGCGQTTCGPVSSTPLPPPPPDHIVNGVQLLTVTDDGHALLRRTSATDRGLDGRADLVALSRTGSADWTMSLADLSGVAVAGDTVFAVGSADPQQPDSRLFAARAATGTPLWRSDDEVVPTTPIAAGGLVYVEGNVFPAGGCRRTTCHEVTSVDFGSGRGSLYGESVTSGTLYANQAGPDGHLFAFDPAG